MPAADASVYLKAMERKRWAFPLVGVAAVRRGGETTVALAGVAPIPWLLDGALDDATPLPGNAYKVEIATALVKRAARAHVGCELKRRRRSLARGRARPRRAAAASKKRRRRPPRRRRPRRPPTRTAARPRHAAARRGAARAEADDGRSTRRRPTTSRCATNCGSFTIRLDRKTSPNAAASFVVARPEQASSTAPSSTGSSRTSSSRAATRRPSGTGGPGYTTVDTPPAARSTRTASSRWRRRRPRPPGTSGSQFFVVTGADAGLPPDYAVLGTSSTGSTSCDGSASSATRAPSSRPRLVEIERADRHASRDGRGGRAGRRSGDAVRRAEAATVAARGARGACARRRSPRSWWCEGAYPLDEPPGRDWSHCERLGRRARRIASLRPGRARATTSTHALVVLADGPSLDPRAVERAGRAPRRRRPSSRRATTARSEPPGRARARSLGDGARRGRTCARAGARRLLRPPAARRRRLSAHG